MRADARRQSNTTTAMDTEHGGSCPARGVLAASLPYCVSEEVLESSTTRLGSPILSGKAEEALAGSRPMLGVTTVMPA
jgi:hypothetical protein